MVSSERNHTLRHGYGYCDAQDARRVLLLGIPALVLLVLGQRAAWLLPTLSPTTLMACKLLLLAPWIEELFFRGVLHAALLRAEVPGYQGLRIPPWMVNALTALCFGAAHLLYAPWFHALAVMAPALLIGWVYERSRKVWTCVALHSFCNFLWIVWR